MLYIRCYKVLYLFVVIANVILRFQDTTFKNTNRDWIAAYVCSAVALIIHAAMWAGLEKRIALAVTIEKILWAGRCVLILGISLFLYILVPILPTGDILWLPLIRLMPRVTYWLALAGLLAVEVIYFIKLRNLGRQLKLLPR